MDKFKERTGIYHEHQDGFLCGQHTLNNLLQSQMFSADSLADIARELDKDERQVLSHTKHCSENMDDTGFFNIQVLQLALKMFNLELVSLASQEDIAKEARNNPESMTAYICNLGLHWFAIRRFGRHYFNLNSIYYVPELIPGATLQINFNFIQESGYSVFIVHGELPACLADQLLTINPINRREYELLTKDLPKLMIDGKPVKDIKDLYGYNDGKLRLPPELLDQYKKNPNDPKVQEKVLEYLPKELRDQIVPGSLSDLGAPKGSTSRLLLISNSRKSDMDEALIAGCDCSYHRQVRQLLQQDGASSLNNNLLMEDPEESQIMTAYAGQLIVRESTSVDSNGPSEGKVVLTRKVTLITRSGNINNPQNMSNPFPQIAPSDVEFDQEEDRLLQYALKQSLNDSAKPKTEIDTRSYDERLEELDKKFLEASLNVGSYGDRFDQLEKQYRAGALEARLYAERIVELEKQYIEAVKNVRSFRDGMAAFEKESLEAAIAASLESSSPTNKQLEATPDSTIKTDTSSSPEPKIDLERTPTVNSNPPKTPPPSPVSPIDSIKTIPSSSETKPITNVEQKSTINVSSTPKTNSEQVPITHIEPAPPMNSTTMSTKTSEVKINPESNPVINSNKIPTLKLSTRQTNFEQTPVTAEEQKPTVELEQTLTNNSVSSTKTQSLSSSLSLTNPENLDSLSVEELRERRLLTRGNKKRSIIAAVSNFDD